MIVGWRCVDTPVGPVFAAASAAGLVYVRVDTPLDRAMEGLTALLAQRVSLGDTIHLEEGGGLSGAAAEQIGDYFAGLRPDIDLPIDVPQATKFQSRVSETVRAIPAGETRTYSEVARLAGYRGAARAVGGVMRDNPVPLAVPCHRVVASSGLGGYGGRPDLKRRLLEHEGALPSR